mmetsp:Transcript_34506/g.106676  ORF Transcript_34506/g.106676 Transcript_34506/m.106676 type:complete len:86 (+) Transcript_34506:1104-1361(+)
MRAASAPSSAADGASAGVKLLPERVWTMIVLGWRERFSCAAVRLGALDVGSEAPKGSQRFACTMRGLVRASARCVPGKLGRPLSC